MRLLRYFYIDEIGLSSLHAQLAHGEVTESTFASEETSGGKKSLKLSFLSLFGAVDIEGLESAKKATMRKLRLKAENMLLEIAASLRATGELHTEFPKAADATSASGEPVWFYGRQKFRAPQFIDGVESANRDRSIIFEHSPSDYDFSDRYYKQSPAFRIVMSASLFKFPGAHDGQLGPTSHEALFFRQFVTEYISLLVFGSVYRAAESYQIKPLALSV